MREGRRSLGLWLMEVACVGVRSTGVSVEGCGGVLAGLVDLVIGLLEGNGRCSAWCSLRVLKWLAHMVSTILLRLMGDTRTQWRDRMARIKNSSIDCEADFLVGKSASRLV